MNRRTFLVHFIALFLTLFSVANAFLPPVEFSTHSQTKTLTPPKTSDLVNNKSFYNSNGQRNSYGVSGQLNTRRNGSIRRVIY